MRDVKKVRGLLDRLHRLPDPLQDILIFERKSRAKFSPKGLSLGALEQLEDIVPADQGAPLTLFNCTNERHVLQSLFEDVEDQFPPFLENLDDRGP